MNSTSRFVDLHLIRIWRHCCYETNYEQTRFSNILLTSCPSAPPAKRLQHHHITFVCHCILLIDSSTMSSASIIFPGRSFSVPRHGYCVSFFCHKCREVYRNRWSCGCLRLVLAFSIIDSDGRSRHPAFTKGIFLLTLESLYISVRPGGSWRSVGVLNKLS